jgi:hypothetical protein
MAGGDVKRGIAKLDECRHKNDHALLNFLDPRNGLGGITVALLRFRFRFGKLSGTCGTEHWVSSAPRSENIIHLAISSATGGK